jgi:hypothetical protein
MRSRTRPRAGGRPGADGQAARLLGRLPWPAGCRATPEMGFNGDLTCPCGERRAGRGLPATGASLAKIASAAGTVLVPSALLGHPGQPWADAAPAGGANAGCLGCSGAGRC